jgi:hypothetical protein
MGPDCEKRFSLVHWTAGRVTSHLGLTDAIYSGALHTLKTFFIKDCPQSHIFLRQQLT